MINVYVVQIVLILFLGLIFRDNKKKFLTISFILLFVLMAFRNARMVGNDSATSYYTEFNSVRTAELSWPNPGLTLVMKVIRHFTDDYQWVIIITAIWVCFAYYRLLVKYSENGFISVMWFMGMLFYTFLFSALKQAWAMAFLCFAFDAIIKKKPIRFLLFVGLATVFHLPALVFLPAYWIAKLKINRAFPLLMMGALAVVFVFRTRILNYMTSIYDEGAGSDATDVRFIGGKVLLIILIIGYAFYRYFKVDKGNKVFGVLMYFMGFAAVIQTFCFYDNIFERLADYYYQFSILFMPLILKREPSILDVINDTSSANMNNTQDSSITNTKRRIGNFSINDIDISTVLAIIITAFCIWRFVSATQSSSDALLPFYFFWQGK